MAINRYKEDHGEHTTYFEFQEDYQELFVYSSKANFNPYLTMTPASIEYLKEVVSKAEATLYGNALATTKTKETDLSKVESLGVF